MPLYVRIVHALSPVYISGLQTILKAVLSLAANQNFQSLSIPPIEVSSSIPLDRVAQCTAKEVVMAAHQKTLNNLTNIRLMGYTTEEYTALDSSLKNAVTHTGDDVKNCANAVMVPIPSTWVPQQASWGLLHRYQLLVTTTSYLLLVTTVTSYLLLVTSHCTNK